MNYLIPISGIFIGWLTNVLAVEMLFKPKKPLGILGLKIPFTPGLVPQNKEKIIKTASGHVSEIIIDSLTTDHKKEVFNLFNEILDKYWLTSIFVPEYKRRELYDKMVVSFVKSSSFEEIVPSIINNQMLQYDMDHFEKIVRKLAKESLRGIKLLGGIVGGLVGLLTMFLGVY